MTIPVRETHEKPWQRSKKQKPHTHVIRDDMNMGFKGGWNRMSLVEMLDTKLYPMPPIICLVKPLTKSIIFLFQLRMQSFSLAIRPTSTSLKAEKLEKELSIKGKWSGELLQKADEMSFVVFSMLGLFGVVDYSLNQQKCPVQG
jgi:hypothetical protein